MWITGNKIRAEVLRGEIKITPFHDSNINPNSYNYTLFPVLKRIKNETIDIHGKDEYEEITIGKDGYVLLPGECYLGCTNEVFSSDKYASLVTGRSSVGRKFITNHITAGLIDQGFNGRITLEITAIKPTRIYPHIPFGQIFWFTTKGKPSLYQGRYQNQVSPEISKISQGLLAATKQNKIYLVSSEKNGGFNFENDLYLKKNPAADLRLKFNKTFCTRLSSLVKSKNVDRIEITGGEDPLENPDIDQIISFIKERLSAKIKIYTKGKVMLNLPRVEEINICFLFKNQSLKALKKSLNHYRKHCVKLRLAIPLTKSLNSKRKIRKLASALRPYCDEIVFRPLTKRFSKYNKYKAKKILTPVIDNVKYDKIENDTEKNDHLLILPSRFLD